MIVDPAVSRRKFAKEVAIARAQQHLHKQGIWILRSEYPIVFVAVVTQRNMPVVPGVLCAVHIDFTDYDVRPPSVRFVDPFTELPVASQELKWDFPKVTNVVPDPASGGILSAEIVPYVQSFDQNRPFLCIPGIREYHDCSGHTGDSWFLHRGTKGCLLVHLLTMLQRFGPGAVNTVHVSVSHSIVRKAVQ